MTGSSKEKNSNQTDGYSKLNKIRYLVASKRTIIMAFLCFHSTQTFWQYFRCEDKTRTSVLFSLVSKLWKMVGHRHSSIRPLSSHWSDRTHHLISLQLLAHVLDDSERRQQSASSLWLWVRLQQDETFTIHQLKMTFKGTKTELTLNLKYFKH